MKYLLPLLLLTACATPITLLENPKTHQLVQCGGGTAGSIIGGGFGYEIQKDNDRKCVNAYEKQGFIKR